MITRSLKRIAAAVSGPSTEQRELAYLNESVSLIDLESRQRDIDRGRFRKAHRHF